MLDTLITSKTRIKLLLKFFLNSNSSSYLRELENEFGESTNGIRLELNRFEKAGLLEASSEGHRKIYRANISHPLYPDINNILLKYIGFDKIIENVIEKLGRLDVVYVAGAFAHGIDKKIIDLIFVSDQLDREYLTRLIAKVEKLISRKVRYLVYTAEEFGDYEKTLKGEEVLLLWKE
jgi:hypothetical protein